MKVMTLFGTRPEIIRLSRIIQKLDDDDYYHPDFLRTAPARLPAQDRALCLAAWDCFLILHPGERALRYSGHGWKAARPAAASWPGLRRSFTPPQTPGRSEKKCASRHQSERALMS